MKWTNTCLYYKALKTKKFPYLKTLTILLFFWPNVAVGECVEKENALRPHMKFDRKAAPPRFEGAPLPRTPKELRDTVTGLGDDTKLIIQLLVWALGKQGLKEEALEICKGVQHSFLPSLAIILSDKVVNNLNPQITFKEEDKTLSVIIKLTEVLEIMLREMRWGYRGSLVNYDISLYDPHFGFSKGTIFGRVRSDPNIGLGSATKECLEQVYGIILRASRIVVEIQRSGTTGSSL